MKMITREEYNKALDIVEEYHKQIETHKKEVENNSKVPLETWFNENNHLMSTRLRNSLYTNYGSYQREREFAFLYLEDITEEKFMRIRNTGTNTWEELNNLLNPKNVVNSIDINKDTKLNELFYKGIMSCRLLNILKRNYNLHHSDAMVKDLEPIKIKEFRKSRLVGSKTVNEVIELYKLLNIDILY